MKKKYDKRTKPFIRKTMQDKWSLDLNITINRAFDIRSLKCCIIQLKYINIKSGSWNITVKTGNWN